MSDKELLELAAKAAGYDYTPRHGAIVADGMLGNWNPLEDDGDALRLAAKLLIDIGQFPSEVVAAADVEIILHLLGFYLQSL